MALGPGLVLAEGVGSAFCPLSLSRRLRLFAAPALPVSHAARSAQTRAAQHGEAGLLERTIASDATYLWPETASLGDGCELSEEARIAYAVMGR